jgi:coenzyme F420-dependent glucose-6-phosphate dehydrogenase
MDYGFDHLVFHAPGDDQSRFISLYAKEILPRLRALAPQYTS